MSTGAFSVCVTPSISDIDEQEWDSLVGSNAVTSHGWLKAFEEESAGGFEPFYLRLCRDGQTVGATACFLCRPGSRLSNPDEIMYGRFGRLPALLNLTFSPAMVVGPHGPYGFHQTFLLGAKLSDGDRHRAFEVLLNGIEDLARSTGTALHFPNLTTGREPELTLLLTNRNYLSTRAFPVCYLDIEWDSFQGYLSYLSSFSSKMKGNVKEEMSRFERAGLTIEVLDNPAEHRARLFELADSHYRSYNNRGIAFTPEFLPTLKASLGQNAVFYGAFRKRELVGFVVLVRRGDVGYLTWTGIDRLATLREGTYFNLVFYRPIQEAIKARIKKLYFGRALYETKLRRGCRLYGPRYFYRSNDRVSHRILRSWFTFHESWMKRKMGEIEELESLRHSRSVG